jgi:predicted NBD/HSP70 family sugar kinase
MDTQRAVVSRLLARPLSLADLRDATGISVPTLRRAVQALADAGWLRVAGRALGTGGRPATLYGIDPSHHLLVGVLLEHPGLRLVATDLLGHVLDERVPDGVGDLDPDAVVAHVVAYLTHLRARFRHRRLVGLGVASPGYVDPTTGSVLAIGRVPSWSNLPLRQRLAEATGLHVTIGNDIDAMAAVEFGDLHDERTFAYVGVTEGVKFSLFLAGRPYVGPFGNAGLVNPHLLVAHGARANAGALLTVHGLVAAYSSASPPGSAGAARVAAHADAWARFRAVLELADEGVDAVATELADAMTDLLGAQLASFVYLIQPELLVIGGAMAEAPARVLAAVEAALRRRLPTLLDNNLAVRRARDAAPSAATVGATRAFLQRFLAEDGAPLAAPSTARSDSAAA